MREQKTILMAILLSLFTICARAGNVYFVSPDGNDANTGKKEAPMATLNAVQAKLMPGDTVYFRGGKYEIQQDQIMTKGDGLGQYSYVFDLNKSGNATDGRIVYAGYPGERPVFDFCKVRPSSRVSAFRLHGSYLYLKNFDIIGVQVTLHGHCQSECITADNGSHCIVENIAMHDNMAIGYYQIRGSDNLVLNCDAYCNFDDFSAFKTDADYENYLKTGKIENISETFGGNCDGFGFHGRNAGCTGNVFRGCRAWWNSDDGFDCINSMAPVVWEDCWAFYNGFAPNSAKSSGDGNGFKAGGYGMAKHLKKVDLNNVPRNMIRNCVSFYNKASGFYSNHHVGGNNWENNTAMYNGRNYNMTNRDTANVSEARDVPGYGHDLFNNVSCQPRVKDQDWYMLDSIRSICTNNTLAEPKDFVAAFIPKDMANIELAAKRKTDGSLPDIYFLTAPYMKRLFEKNQGALFEIRK